MKSKYIPFYFLILVAAIMLLSCKLFSASVPEKKAPATPVITTAPVTSGKQNTPTEPSTSGDAGLRVNYTYTDNLITSIYHLYGTVLDHFVDITVTNTAPEAVTVIVQTQVDGYTVQAADTIDLRPGESLALHQNPLLIPEAVDRLNSQKPGNFHIHVDVLSGDEQRTVMDETRSILIYSRRDFVWVPGFEWREEYELWAAWVTPNDPSVEALIRAAANYDSTGIITSGYGDQADDGDGSVWRRLEAIWKAEANDYKLTYISTMTTFGPGSVQRMRLPAEVLEQSGGNCVELAALFASAAEALGMEAAIVRVPGHAFTAIRTDLENAQYYFIETTMIGQNSFSEAIIRGNEEWTEAQPHFDAGEEGYAWVTIPIARAKGILPIPWR